MASPLSSPLSWRALQPFTKGFAGFLEKSLIPQHVAVIAPEAAVAAVQLQGLFSAVPGFLDLSTVAATERPSFAKRHGCWDRLEPPVGTALRRC